MKNTLVIQSHQSPLPYPWINRCLASVRRWCAINQYEYHFIGDELFDCVPNELMKKTSRQRVITSDLARLFALSNALKKNFETVIWLDADFLIFGPENFVLPDSSYALGREVWVQHDKHGRLKVYKKVHNAFLMFRETHSFLDFYLSTSQRLLSKTQGPVPPQFIGPKLLTALHNIAMLSVMESAGVLSPLVIKDILQGGGSALALFTEYSSQTVAGVNLCISSCIKNDVTDNEMNQVIDRLLDKKRLSEGAA